MRVTRLKLTNVRAIEVAEFRFSPGFNLIVGVNGVGKSTVLEALAICLSAVVKQSTRLGIKSRSFLDDDIRKGARALTAECGIWFRDSEYTYLIHKSRRSGEVQSAKVGMPREQALETPDKAEFVGKPPAKIGEHPLGLLFSTRRAVPSQARVSKGSSAGTKETAYADAFANRELRVSEFAAWMRAQQKIKNETPAAERLLEAFERATSRFLPGYRNIRPTDEIQPRLLIDRGEKVTVRVDELSDIQRAGLKEAVDWSNNWMALNWKPDPRLKDLELQKAASQARHQKMNEALSRLLPEAENLRPRSDDGAEVIDLNPTTLEVSQLSDGERGILALVLDITRRISQANPNLRDPAAEAEAVVLIDEIDLHLHPNWQRQIVGKLLSAFPRCQFIATTHSPQIIGEVQHNSIQIIAHGQVYPPTHSFGVDSSRVLTEIMEADSRTQQVKDVLSQFSEEVGKQNFENARQLLRQLATQLGESDPDVIRSRTLLDFMEGKE